MIKGATIIMVIIEKKYSQSVANVLAGMAMKVMALNWVPKILRPAAH